MNFLVFPSRHIEKYLFWLDFWPGDSFSTGLVIAYWLFLNFLSFSRQSSHPKNWLSYLV